MSQSRMSSTARVVLTVLLVVAGIAVLCFGASVFVSGDLKSALRMVSYVSATGAAILALVFAVVGGKK